MLTLIFAMFSLFPNRHPAQLDLNALVAQLQENPELLATLSQLLGGNQVIRAAV